MQPFFEIILPTCNRPDLCRRAVKSVLSQTHRNFRLWVLDSNSSEENRKKLATFWENEVENDPRALLLWLVPPKGVVPYSWMTNYVYKELKQDAWVSYLTDDAYYPPDRLEIFAELIGRLPNAKVLYGEQIRINCGSGRFPSADGVFRLHSKSVQEPELLEHNWIDHNAVVHKVDLLLGEEKPWVEDLQHIKVGDWRCWQKLIKKAQFFFTSRVVAIDEWWPNGLSENNALQLQEKFGVSQ